MKRKVIKFIIGLCLMVLVVFHSYYLTPLYSYDELWIYGFGVNIVNGLVPYRDFNMVITPIFPYLLSIFLSIFSKKLLVYHIVIASMVVFITYLASLKIKYYSLLIYVALLIFSINGYNTSTLMWLFILFIILDKKVKYQDILVPLIVSIMILTKQSLALLIIPSLIYSKNRKKTLAVYLTCFFGFLLYLISCNNLLEFLNYCVFGMFEFASENTLSLPIFVFIELLMVGWLVWAIIKKQGSKEIIAYVLAYQIMTYPICDIHHFILGWVAFLYVFFEWNGISKTIKNALFIILIILEGCLVFTNNSMFSIRNREFLQNYPDPTFMYDRLVPLNTRDYISNMNTIIKKYPDHELYILGMYSYLVKLNLDIPINKFDLINNGNMGYNGEAKYIEEIDEKCLKKKCLFIVNEKEIQTEDYNQTNKEILKHVVDKYAKIYSSNFFGAYVN